MDELGVNMRALVNSLYHWDVIFFTTIFGLNGRKFISVIMPYISHTGNGYYYPALPAVVFLFQPEIAMTFFMAALLAYAVEVPLFIVMKRLVKRDRPCEVLADIQNRIIPSDQFSFPSGHTSAAFVMATLVSYFFPLLALPACLWALLVGLSRIYLGVHYPTDILAGIFIGTLTAVFSILCLY